MTDVVIPVKELSHAKSRLQGILSPQDRAGLAQAMLCDVLTTLKQCDLGCIWLVSSDAAALSVGARFGARAINETSSRGYNHAVSVGLGCVATNQSVLVMPADIPMIKPSDITRMLDQCDPHPATVGIVPDRHNRGTNGLYLCRPDVIAPAFGANSFFDHRAAAARAGITATEVVLENMAMDIDTPDDLLSFAQTGLPGATTDFLNAIPLGRSTVIKQIWSVA